jgi:hypothetical protein
MTTALSIEPTTTWDTAPISQPASPQVPDYSNTSVMYPAAPAYNPLFIVPGGKAAEMGATLTRAQWNDYLARFQPIENALIASTGYMNPSIYTNQVQEGIRKTGTAFDAATGMKNTALSRMGLAPTAEQQAYLNKVNNIGRSAAVVDAANTIRQRIADRDRAIMMGTGYYDPSTQLNVNTGNGGS